MSTPSQSIEELKRQYNECGFKTGFCINNFPLLLELAEQFIAAHASQTAEPNGIIELAICEEITKRREKGLWKYGVGVERTDLTISQWLQHAKEEAMDLAIYLERIKREITAAHASQTATHEKQVAELKEQNAILQSQVDNADVNLEQSRLNGKHLLDKSQKQTAELERKLAEALDEIDRLRFACSGHQLDAGLLRNTLFAAEAHIGVLRKALEYYNGAPWAENRTGYWAQSNYADVAEKALASSPDPTLKDRVVEVLKLCGSVIPCLEVRSWPPGHLMKKEAIDGIRSLLTELGEQP